MFEVLGYLDRPRASARDRGETDVRGDCVQPRAELRARRVAFGALPRAQHRFLNRVVGVVERAEHPVAVEVERPPVWLDQERERDRKSTRLNSSHDQISYAVFCLK